MAEYLVKIEASAGYFMPRKYHTSEIYEANSAKEAKEKCLKEFKDACRKEGVDPDDDDINFAVTDIKKI